MAIKLRFVAAANRAVRNLHFPRHAYRPSNTRCEKLPFHCLESCNSRGGISSGRWLTLNSDRTAQAAFVCVAVDGKGCTRKLHYPVQNNVNGWVFPFSPSPVEATQNNPGTVQKRDHLHAQNVHDDEMKFLQLPSQSHTHTHVLTATFAHFVTWSLISFHVGESVGMRPICTAFRWRSPIALRLLFPARAGSRPEGVCRRSDYCNWRAIKCHNSAQPVSLHRHYTNASATRTTPTAILLGGRAGNGTKSSAEGRWGSGRDREQRWEKGYCEGVNELHRRSGRLMMVVVLRLSLTIPPVLTPSGSMRWNDFSTAQLQWYNDFRMRWSKLNIQPGLYSRAVARWKRWVAYVCLAHILSELLGRVCLNFLFVLRTKISICHNDFWVVYKSVYKSLWLLLLQSGTSSGMDHSVNPHS